jgi:hypothetical protein
MHGKLLMRLREACPAYSTITSWIRALSRGEDIKPHASNRGRLPIEIAEALIVEALEEAPFPFVRS